MKTLFGALAFIFVCLAISLGGKYYINVYAYNVNVSQYVKLADDASTPQMKLFYLNSYVKAVNTYVNRNEARYIFKQPRLTKETQLKVVGSLVERVKDLSLMSPDSLPYQQGMQQVSGQEFDHVLDAIDQVFKDCYFRTSFFLFASLALCACCFVLAAVCCFVVFVRYSLDML